jgi:hypothetical protein
MYKNCWNIAKNVKYSSKYGGNFCPFICNTGVISLAYQEPFCFGHFVFKLVFSCTVPVFTGRGFFGIRKINVRVPSWKKARKHKSTLVMRATVFGLHSVTSQDTEPQSPTVEITRCKTVSAQKPNQASRIQGSVTHKLSSKTNLAASCIAAQERRNCNAQQMRAVLHISQADSLNSIRLLYPHRYQSGAYVPHYLTPASTVKKCWL